MTLPSRQVHVRLPEELAKKFDDACAEYPAIQPAVILRLMVSSVLEKPKEEVAEIVMRQLRKPSSQIRKPKKAGLNTRNRIAGE